MDPSWASHIVNHANEINQIAFSSGQPIQFQHFLNDPAGNLLSDGLFIYQYDAWNRLIQVNQLGTVAIETVGANAFKIISADQLGALVCRYSYDGFGRLIVKENTVV